MLILSPSAQFREEIVTLLKQYEHYDFNQFSQWTMVESIVDEDVAIIDEEAIDNDPTSYLARLSYQFSPIPIIYVTSKLDSEESFKAVKSLTTDFLLKDQLTSAALHNCIRYSLESWQMKLEMERQQKRYMSLFYNAVDPCFYLGPDWSIENVNEAFCSTFGITKSRSMELGFVDLLYDSKYFKEFTQLVEVDGKTAIDREIKFLQFDNNKSFLGHLKISVLTNFTAVDGRSVRTIDGFQGSLTNISYKSRIRNIKARAEKVSLTYRLARTLAHEIRNPLTNITLAIDQVEDEIGQTEESEMYLGIIKRSTARIDNLINQLIHSSEQHELIKSDCNLVDIFEKALDSVHDRAKLRRIKIITDFETVKLPYSCDREKLTLAIINLLTNALEAIEKERTDGSITVGSFTENGYCCLFVRDNGEGMTEHQLESLFDPFFTSKKKGVGLGLTASQTIIADHSGEIEVESQLGIGSTFTISLPNSNSKS